MTSHAAGLLRVASERLRDGRTAEAIALFEQVLELEPGSLEAIVGLGQAWQALGRAQEAEAAFRRAVERHPMSADARFGLGNALQSLRRPDEAIACFEQVLKLLPGNVIATVNLAVAQHAARRYDAALRNYRRALAAEPALAIAHANAGNTLSAVHAFAEAARRCRRALAVAPDFMTAARNLRAILLYDPDATNAVRWAATTGFVDRQAPSIERMAARIRPARPPDPERRLRLGYVSSDLSSHPVGRNMLPLLENRDRRNFDAVVYSDVAIPDATTERIRRTADLWRTTLGLDDRAVADLVRADGIDVLIVLAAWNDNNRPLLAAHRAAPVQVSYHDIATSGVAAMDYLIADRTMIPKRGSERFSERVLATPRFYLHAPIDEAPAVGPPPCLARGGATFACFNNPIKLNAELLRLWGAVLGAAPKSRLLLKYGDAYASPELRRSVLRHLGVAADRVTFDAVARPLADHLDLYRQADLTLDTFPFAGSTTTFESLWMGVPVVSRLGDNMVGRWTAAILEAVGLRDCVVGNADAYVETAAGLARDGTRLGRIRTTLRERVLRSSLCDGGGRARQMERWYRAIWRRWCRRIQR